MKAVVLAVALLTGVSSAALAADLPTAKGPPPAPAYAPPLPFSWSGFYLGVNGGWGWNSLGSSNFANGNGGVIGGTAGFNWQMGQIVAGAEADFDGTNMVSTNSYTLGSNKFGTHDLTTERLRLGYAIDRTLLFITGGYAGMGTTGQFTDTVNNISGWNSAWRNGGALGGGVEYAFTNNISAKFEYLYVPFSNQTYFSGTPDAESNSLTLNLVRAGVNYKF